MIVTSYHIFCKTVTFVERNWSSDLEFEKPQFQDPEYLFPIDVVASVRFEPAIFSLGVT